jgi:CheY-like chemotaxis protein
MDNEQPLVLCVDDDSRTLEILSKIMAHLPVRHATAQHPRAALEQAQQLQPHLLVLDLMLPEMNGWELLAHIRAAVPRPDLRVIVLTAKDGGYERLVATNLARVDLFLAKPFDTADLARRVLELLGLPIGEAWPGPDPHPPHGGAGGH